VSKLVYIIAGEPSGDILASRLMQVLVQRCPDVRFAGVGGETMQALGFRSLFPIKELSVMGFWEVAPRLPNILKRMRQILTDIETQRHNVLVTVDSWGFVSSFLKRFKRRKLSIPVVHYVAPQVWAWQKGRAALAAKIIDRLMILWPYEPPYFEKYGLNCDFVGHPVIENTANLKYDRRAFLSRLQIPEKSTLISLLPGSRHSEVKRLIPIFKRVAVRLRERYPDLFVMIPSVDAIAEEVRSAFADMPVSHCIVRGQHDRYQAFSTCLFAIAASGSVTLELAAFGAPHLIAYRFSPLTNFVVKRLVTTQFANLINIMAKRHIIPEFVLNNCREDLIFEKAFELMQNPTLAQEQVEEAKRYLSQLKPKECMPSEKAAMVVLEEMGLTAQT
jgi:lipid-A-disaccharide synthase